MDTSFSKNANTHNIERSDDIKSSACKKGKAFCTIYMATPWRPDTYQPMAMTERKNNATRMPLCKFGKHCTNKQCIFRHDNNTEQAVCLFFLMDQCAFGAKCRYKHPSDSIQQQCLLQHLATQKCHNAKPCKYGGACLFDCSSAV